MGAQLERRKTGFLVRESNAVLWIFMVTLSGSSLGAVEIDAISALVQEEVEDARDGQAVLAVEAVLGFASRRRWGGTYLATDGMLSTSMRRINQREMI